MRTVIEGGWVVAWNGRSHEVHERGSVVFEDDRIVHAGPAWTGAADARITARGKLVSPGFINTHVHTAGGGGDYLLLDMSKNDYRTANYMSFAAPLRGKMAAPPAEPTAAKPAEGGEAMDFGALVQEAVRSAGANIGAAENQALSVAAGQGDIVDVVTAIAAAETQLQTVMAVRDQVISAYQEILRMPI